MMKYCISKKENQVFSYLLDEKDRTVELHCDIPGSQAKLGDIYVGRVKNIAKNLNAAFVEITPGFLCYLPLEDVKNPVYTKKGSSPNIQQGDELVVQISREAMKTKAPSVTTQLCLSGKYVIVDLAKQGVGISRKLPESKRQPLKRQIMQWIGQQGAGTKLPGGNREETFKPMREIPAMAEQETEIPGIVVRTNAGEAPEEMLLEELEQLLHRIKEIRERASYRTCYSCLYQAPPVWLKRFLGLPFQELSAILIEDARMLRQAEEFLERENPLLLEKLQLYQDSMLSMEKLYSLDRRLKEALQERVWMKSGAYLVIQPTEALTVIDVNSGKFEAGKQKETAIRKVNLEAAREIARQLRLRKLSGIIIVDFINMTEETSRQQVMEELRACLTMDPILTRVIDRTKLDLVEITRKKVERPLAEQVKAAAVQ